MGLWRALGWFLETRVGSAAARMARPLVNLGTRALPPVRLDGPLPFTPLSTPLPQCRVAVVNTAGLYLPGQELFDVDAPHGDPTFRILPSDLDPRELRVAHTHYAHRYFEEDPEVILPVSRLRELAAAGVLELAPRWPSFGFGGLLTREYLDPRNGTAWEVARLLAEDEVDLALLVPA